MTGLKGLLFPSRVWVLGAGAILSYLTSVGQQAFFQGDPVLALLGCVAPLYLNPLCPKAMAFLQTCAGIDRLRPNFGAYR